MAMPDTATALWFSAAFRRRHRFILLSNKLLRARIVEVITNGFGVMYPFADRMPPRDRWAIASYVKALQLSQSFPIDRLPDDLRSQVEP